MFVAVFKESFYTIYLNQLYSDIIDCRHLTVFAFSFIYFLKIPFVVTMWTVLEAQHGDQ